MAMTFGIGGAIFFSRFFVIFLSLKPEVAIALGHSGRCVRRLKMDPALAAGTSVLIIAVTALVTSMFNLSFFAVADLQDLVAMAQISTWAVPGVVLGAQLGVRISQRIDGGKALLLLSLLFGAMGILTLLNALL